jgi:hypothetical protein
MSLRDVRTHYFHANATAIGGYITRPVVKDIPVQSPTALSPSGGSDEACTSRFQFEQIMTASTTRSRVEGRIEGISATTQATATVQGLNVLGMVRADEVMAYISTRHPGQEPDVPMVHFECEDPSVDFGKTHFKGLQIGNSSLNVQLDLKLLGNGTGDTFPTKPHVFEQALWEMVGQKFDNQKGFLQCSLVKNIEVTGEPLPGKLIEPNIIEIQNFGRVHLAELLVSGNSYELIMIRLELGCTNEGSTTMSATKVNGGGH